MAKSQSPAIVGKIDIESLMKREDSIKASSVKNALATLKKKQQEEEEAKVLQHLSNIQSNTASAVFRLKHARKSEKKAKEYLTAVAIAEQNFLANADIEAYNIALKLAGNRYYS